MTRQPSTREPRTAAGRNLSGLLRDARIYWPDNLTRIASTATDEWIAAIEAEAAAPVGSLDVALHDYLHNEGVWSAQREDDEDEDWHWRVCEGAARLLASASGEAEVGKRDDS